jgi:hypothetical protein
MIFVKNPKKNRDFQKNMILGASFKNADQVCA